MPALLLAILASCATLPEPIAGPDALDVPVGTSIYAEADTVALDDYLLSAVTVITGLDAVLADRILGRIERVTVAARDPIGCTFGASIVAEGRIARGTLRLALRFSRDFRVARRTGLPGTVWESGEGAERVRIAPLSRDVVLLELGTGINSMERGTIPLSPEARTEREQVDLFAIASGGIAALLPVSPDASAGLSIREIRASAVRDQPDTAEDALLVTASIDTRSRGDARALSGVIRLSLIAERGRAAAAEIPVIPEDSTVLIGPLRITEPEFAGFVATTLTAPGAEGGSEQQPESGDSAE